MGKWIRRGIMLILLVIFLVSGGMILSILHQYRVSERKYEDAVLQFTTPADDDSEAETVSSDIADNSFIKPGDADNTSQDGQQIIAPFVVDFDALHEIAPDAIGWLYCKDTIINYPVMFSGNNSYYLHRSYDKTYSFPGSIFVDCLDDPSFQDYNTIIYGHNMKDGTMFANLDMWSSQSYYNKHPVMWLLTPEQDYLVVLIAGYTTTSTAECYAIIHEPGPDLDLYLADALANSDFQASVDPDPTAHYVLLSTCSYVFSNARYVIHGMLVPVDSAGGRPISRS